MGKKNHACIGLISIAKEFSKPVLIIICLFSSTCFRAKTDGTISRHFTKKKLIIKNKK